MPVQKFRSIEDMNRAQVLPRADNAFERFIRHCARYGALATRRFQPGVVKFRSIEEAQRARYGAVQDRRADYAE